ncbi:hypothetical protein BaRGS_00030820, partial [Batillaria attramentaria]
DIVSHLKQLGCKNVDEITEKADLYKDANPGKSFARKAGADAWTSKPIDVNDALETCSGTLNDQEVKVLLDSVCTTVGVRKSLLSEDQYTGEIRHCTAFGGEILSYPVARVHLDTVDD